MKVPGIFAANCLAAAAKAGVSPEAVFRECLYMTPDGFLLNEVPIADAKLVDFDIPAELVPVLEDMAAAFGFTVPGLVLTMSKYTFRAAGSLVAENEELARECRRMEGGATHGI